MAVGGGSGTSSLIFSFHRVPFYGFRVGDWSIWETLSAVRGKQQVSAPDACRILWALRPRQQWRAVPTNTACCCSPLPQLPGAHRPLGRFTWRGWAADGLGRHESSFAVAAVAMEGNRCLSPQNWTQGWPFCSGNQAR